MRIYLVVRTDSGGYDTYDSFVVCEEDSIRAMKHCEQHFSRGYMTCEFIGTANSKQVAGTVLGSFNAG